MLPEIVVFDLGKVLVDFDYSLSAQRISAQGTMAPEAAQHFMHHSPLLCRYETGLLTSEQFFQAIRDASGFRGTFEMFTEFFTDVFTPIEPMVAWHARLCERGIATYIFSNTNDLAITQIGRSFPFFSQFNGYVYSYQHGAMKPDARLYAVMEQMADKRGPQILYLDDRLENVEAGKARGWQVIHHQTPDQTFAELDKLGMR